MKFRKILCGVLSAAVLASMSAVSYAAVDTTYATEIAAAIDDFNSNTQTDSPDGTGYLQPTTAAGSALSIGSAKTETYMSLDFRFDAEECTMRFTNSKNKTGPMFSLSGGVFRTQTGSSSYQTIYSGMSTGEWYNMELEGTAGIENASMSLVLYKYNGSEKEQVATVDSLNLRNFGNASNGDMGWLEINVGVSVDNSYAAYLWADEVRVTSLADSVNGGSTVLLSAAGYREDKAVTTPDFEWSLYDTAGNPLTDDSVSITSDGLLVTTADVASQTVVVRATAQTQGNPYGEYNISIKAVDTSSDIYDTLTLSADRSYVRVNEPLTITAAATMNGTEVDPSSDINWAIYNAADLREVTNKNITVEDGVLSVTADAVSQDIVVRAYNGSGSVSASYSVNVRPSMLRPTEEGTGDIWAASNACEEYADGVTLTEGAPDGSGYYEVNTAMDFDGFSANTNLDVAYSADMKFNSNGAGWVVWNSSKGKQGLQLTYNASTGMIGIVKDSSNTYYYVSVDSDSWYHIEIMCATGNSSTGTSYANLIVYKYDENGDLVHPTTGAAGTPFVESLVPMRNLDESSANHVCIQAGTSVDNVMAVYTSPDKLTVSSEESSVLAGGTVTATATASRNGVDYPYIGTDLVEWAVYDSEDKYPTASEYFTITDGTMTVDALAEPQTVYIRASVSGGELYDSIPIEVKSSDLFTINAIGVSEDYSKVLEIDVSKNFPYSDDVTFTVCVYGSDGVLKGCGFRNMKGKNISEGDDTVYCSIDLPTDFDPEADTLKIITITKF